MIPLYPYKCIRGIKNLIDLLGVFVYNWTDDLMLVPLRLPLLCCSVCHIAGSFYIQCRLRRSRICRKHLRHEKHILWENAFDSARRSGSIFSACSSTGWSAPCRIVRCGGGVVFQCKFESIGNSHNFY